MACLTVSDSPLEVNRAAIGPQQRVEPQKETGAGPAYPASRTPHCGGTRAHVVGVARLAEKEEDDSNVILLTDPIDEE